LLFRIAAGQMLDREEAIPLWHRLQRIVRDEQPWSFLYTDPSAYLLRDRVRGVSMDIRGALSSVTRWWVVDAPP